MYHSWTASFADVCGETTIRHNLLRTFCTFPTTARLTSETDMLGDVNRALIQAAARVPPKRLHGTTGSLLLVSAIIGEHINVRDQTLHKVTICGLQRQARLAG